MDSFDYTRELDKVKSRVFLGKNAAFLGSLMCSLKFEWMETGGTAATDGETIWYDRAFFQKSSPNLREFALVHELWHVARLHPIRRGSRDHKLWVIACDLRINHDLVEEGFKFDDFKPWYDPTVGTMSEEEIYEGLISGAIETPQGGWLGGDEEDDLQEVPSNVPAAAIVNKVVHAHQQAKMANAGKGLGDIEKVLSEFLDPIIPWQTVLYNFFTDLESGSYSWMMPNRRYPDMYLPGRAKDESRLEHLAYYIDVSGSVSEADVLRFNSEVKYIKDTFNPQLLTLVQFDDGITRIDQFDEMTPFDKVVTVGRGGTELEPVRQHILKTQPTAAIIFTDLHCWPMQPLPYDIPIIWIVTGNPHATVPFGRIIHI